MFYNLRVFLFIVYISQNLTTAEQPVTLASEEVTTVAEIEDNSVIGLERYVEQVLKAHNEYRKFHGVPPLQLQEELTKKSQVWADHLAEINTIENSFSDYAENIYAETINAEQNGTSPVKFWYDKIQFYKPGKITDNWWDAASFTQLIWAKSKHLGVGMAENKDYRFVVCFYNPPGNTIGQDPLDVSVDFPELPLQKTFYILPGGVFKEGNENENLTSSVLKQYIEDVLEAHNQFRALHGVPPLHLHEELTKESQAWADELADTDTFHHSTSIYGENIYKEPVYFDRDGMSPVKFWYDEIEYYKFGEEPEDWHKVGHFTQLIWSETTHLGVGLAENDDSRFIVCNYNPRGNIINQSHYEKFIPPADDTNSIFEEFAIHNDTFEDDSTDNTTMTTTENILKMINTHTEPKNEGLTNQNLTELEEKLLNITKILESQDVKNSTIINSGILEKLRTILNRISIS